jgi:hypothetical protein
VDGFALTRGIAKTYPHMTIAHDFLKLRSPRAFLLFWAIRDFSSEWCWGSQSGGGSLLNNGVGETRLTRGLYSNNQTSV